MSDTPAVERPGGSFTSLTELQDEHLRLLEASDALDARLRPMLVGEEPEAADAQAARRELLLLRRRAMAFVRRARSCGERLDESGDRAIAQGALDFWHIRLAYMLRDAERLREIEGRPARHRPTPLGRRPMLAEFDEASAPELSEDQCPFVGLSAFDEKQAREGSYCGREEAVSQLLQRVLAQRLTIVYGPSGSGKSSLVLAGLVPALRAAPGGETLTVWPVVAPGADPIGALLQSVRPAGQEAPPWVAAGRAALGADPASLGDLAVAASGGGPGLLIVDQAEELVLMGSETADREAFAAAVAALATTAQPEHRVIVVAREDFVGRLLQIPALAALPQEAAIAFRPKPMTPAELRLAIEGPARKPGLKFAPGIVDDLVREVADDPAALPLLQFTLMQLWKRRRRNLIHREAYEAVGRPGEALGRVAERVYEELGSVQNQQGAQEIFLTLVVPGVGNEVVRRRVRLETLHALRDPTLIDRVIKPFVEAGLVRRTEGAERGDDRYEVMHEALLRNWPRLGQWVRDVRDQEQDHLLVLNSARIWDKKGRSADHLAVGDAIAHADRYAGKDELIAAYVAASRSAEATKAGTETWRRRKVAGGGSTLLGMLVIAAGFGWMSSAREETSVEDVDFLQNALQTQLTATEAEPEKIVPVQQLQHRAASLFGPGNTGWLWVGSEQTPMLQHAKSLKPVAPSALRVSEGYRPRLDISLRSGLPDEDYVSAPSIGYAPRGALLVLLETSAPYERSSGNQYWARVRMVPRVYIQSVVGTGERAKALRDGLTAAGFEVPPTELLPSAAGKSEVRYFFDQDLRPAKMVANEASRLLAGRRVGVVKSSGATVSNNLEVWVDLSQDVPVRN
ncbi:MAG TPA: ATP-binding protein [Allosphingosinicella sp.]|jgi:hypothetical protein